MFRELIAPRVECSRLGEIRADTVGYCLSADGINLAFTAHKQKSCERNGTLISLAL
jgi:hypothetical protein